MQYLNAWENHGYYKRGPESKQSNNSQDQISLIKRHQLQPSALLIILKSFFPKIQYQI